MVGITGFWLQNGDLMSDFSPLELLNIYCGATEFVVFMSLLLNLWYDCTHIHKRSVKKRWEGKIGIDGGVHF